MPRVSRARRNHTKPTVLDLFCGCGGFSLGAARAGFRVVGAIDNDPRAMGVHERNFPDTKHLNADLSTVSGDEIREMLGLGDTEIDGVIGGPPCQGFSNIGRQEGDDPRNRLYVHFFRLVAELRPSFFLAENVPGLMRPSYSPVRDEATALVSGQYELLQPEKLKADDFGAPTTRTRFFFFGWRKDTGIGVDRRLFLPPMDVEPVTVGEALKGLPRKIGDDWQTEPQGWRKTGTTHNASFEARLHDSVPDGVGDPEALRRLEDDRRVSGCLGTRHAPHVVQRFEAVAPGSTDDVSRCPRLDPKGLCPTLRAGTGSDRGSYQAVRPIHPTEHRVVTPREAARLQGFPDWFQFHATKWHSFRQIGNSVSPILAEHVLGNIRARLRHARRHQMGAAV
jgi:DNA (cytosine-5)-methyltransferase 1